MVLTQAPFVDIFREQDNFLDLLEGDDMLNLMKLEECKKEWKLETMFCSRDGRKLRLQTVVAKTKDGNLPKSATEDHDLSHYIIPTTTNNKKDKQEGICSECHACLGCQKTSSWKERQQMKPVYCNGCPGFWCDECDVYDVFGAGHDRCVCCKEMMCLREGKVSLDPGASPRRPADGDFCMECYDAYLECYDRIHA